MRPDRQNKQGRRSKTPSIYELKPYFEYLFGGKIHQVRASNEYVDLLHIVDGQVTAIKVDRLKGFDQHIIDKSYGRLCDYMDETGLQRCVYAVRIIKQGWIIYQMFKQPNGRVMMYKDDKLSEQINQERFNQREEDNE